MCYQVLFVFLTVFSTFQYLPIVLCLQAVMLTVVIMVRPNFNVFEKPRAVLTWVISLLGTFTVLSKPESFILPLFFLILLSLHVVISVLVSTISVVQQIKRKCNNRSEVVRNLMKEGQV
jgi:hypothetical protein